MHKYYRFVVLVFGLNFLAGCGTSVQAPQLPEGALPWSAERKITWDDFRGTPIAASGQQASNMILHFPSYMGKANLFSKTVVVSSCIMDRLHSWANRAQVTDQMLFYQQTTFDIYELFTRKLRQEFDNTSFGLDDPSPKFNSIFQEYQKRLLDTLSVYQTATRLGEDSTAIRNWSMGIHSELLQLTKYQAR